MNSAQIATATFTIAPDFALSYSAFQPSQITAGESSSAASTLSTGQLDFSTPINFTCTVQPSPALAPQCSLDMTSLTPAGGFSSVAGPTVTVRTTPPSMASAGTLHDLSVSGAMLFASLLCVGIVLPLHRSRKRQVAGVWAVTFAVFVLMLGMGCGGGSTHPPRGGTPPGTYTITVIGTSGSLTHPTTVSLNVQ
jgi:hypothetical protein